MDESQKHADQKKNQNQRNNDYMIPFTWSSRADKLIYGKKKMAASRS